MPQQNLYTAHIVVSVLTGSATALLGFMFWNASITNRDVFTRMFLRLLSISAVVKTLEIGGSMYRTSQISVEHIPADASLVGLVGRGIEMAVYLVMIWFLLRAETRRALNGGKA